MQIKTDLYIDGAWVKGDGALPVYNPSTGEVIAEFQTAGEAQCDAALTAAHNAFPSWAKTAPRVRSEILRKAFDIMTAEADEIAKLNQSCLLAFKCLRQHMLVALQVSSCKKESCLKQS